MYKKVDVEQIRWIITIIIWLNEPYDFCRKVPTFQSTTYSTYKHRNLIKPMTAVLTDGYIALTRAQAILKSINMERSVVFR